MGREASARNVSRRLQRKLVPAALAYGEVGRLLFDHPDRFVAYQIVGYQATVAMDDYMHTALDRAYRLSAVDPVAAGLAPYLERHIVEEQHHAEPGGLTLEDLATVGVDPEQVRQQPPTKQIAALTEFLHERIDDQHPVAVLGFLQLERYHATVEGVEKMITLTGLPRSAFRNLELHAHLDVGHAVELDRAIDSLPLQRWQQTLIFRCAVESIKTMRASFRDLFDAA